MTLKRESRKWLVIVAGTVEEMGTNSSIVQFKRLPAVPKVLCMKHYGPYDRFYESFTEAYAYMEEQGYKVADHPRTCYIDDIRNQEDPEKWLSIIQIPIEWRIKMRAFN